MKASYRISEADHVRVLQLDSKPTYRALIVYLLVAIGIFLTIMFSVEKHNVSTAVGGCISGLLGMLAVHYVAVPIVARRQYRKYQFLREELTLELVPEGVKFSAENGESTLPWKHMLKWRQDEKFILIYSMPKLFYIVPKSLVVDGFDLAGLVEKLSEHVGPPIA